MRATTSRLLALLLLNAGPLPAQSSPGPGLAEARRFVLKAMEEHGIPAVAVAVARHGRIVWEEGFGWADVERRVPATGQTMFSLASISKPITATAVLRLVEEGRIEMDRPANDYLGEAKIHSQRWDPAGATVRRVLSHTAGLPLHYEFFYEGDARSARSTDEGIARYGFLAFPPGEAFQYSNLGYGVLDRIIERVSGRSYAEFMTAEIFEPLGMTRAVVSTGAGLGAAAAVRYDGENRPIPPYDFDHRGGSAVYASARDLARFGLFHLGGRVRGQRPVLGDSMRRTMQRPALPGSGVGYALGWDNGEHSGHRRVRHGGDMPGVETTLDLYPEQGLVVVVLTSKQSGAVGRIADEIARAVLPRPAAAGREQDAEAAEHAVREAPLTPTPELLGEWRGTVRTYEGSTPLVLRVQPDGDVHVALGGEMWTLLNDVSLEGSHLRGYLAGSIPSADARRSPHVVLLSLRLYGGQLVGAASALGGSFALSSFVELAKQPGPRAGELRRDD